MMSTQRFSLFLFLFVFHETFSLRILSLSHTPSYSHYLIMRSINLELVKRGHHVTVLAVDNETSPPPTNYRHFVADDVYEIRETFGFKYESLYDISILDNTMLLLKWVSLACDKVITSQAARSIYELTKNETFDLIIKDSTLGDCTLGFVSEFNYPPLIEVSCFGDTPWIIWQSGIPEHAGYLPYFAANYEAPLNIWQKMETHISNIVGLILMRWIHIPEMENIGRKLFGDRMPSVESILKNASLFLLNKNLARDFARPVPPNVIYIGGVHLKSPKPLPKDLKKWLDEANEGVILFALGTNIKSENLSKDILEILLNTFKRLKERVLWKFESQIDNLPSNVKISKWFPQADVLSHQNVRLLITHGGGLSTTEALYHGVPLILMPFFVDQMSNADKLYRRGMGLKVNLTELNGNDFYEKIRMVIDNPSFKKRAQELQTLYHDEPMKPLEKAIFWIEYVARHRGAKHLRTGLLSLSWYEDAMLDIFVVYLIICLLIAWAVKKLKNYLSLRIFNNLEKKKNL